MPWTSRILHFWQSVLKINMTLYNLITILDKLCCGKLTHHPVGGGGGLPYENDGGARHTF